MSVYLRLLAQRGAVPLALACVLGWLSFASLALAVVLAVQQRTGSFGTAGAAVGAFAGAAGALAPLRGALVDRYRGRALAVFASGYSLSMGALVVGLSGGWSASMLVLSAAAAGLLAPPLIAAARALWPKVAGPDLVRAGHALNALLGDVSAVLGPAAAGALAAGLGPTTALALLAFGPPLGCVLVARLGGGGRPPDDAAPRIGPVRTSAGLRTLLIAGVPLGVALGALDVAAPALADTESHAELAALPLAAFAAGSVVASLWAGQSTRAGAPARRYVAGYLALAVTLTLCLLGPSLTSLSLVLIAAGASFGLVNVAMFELLDVVVPDRHAVEALTWVTTAEGVGLAVGATLAGAIAGRSPDGALTILALAPAVAAALAFTRRRTLQLQARPAIAHTLNEASTLLPLAVETTQAFESSAISVAKGAGEAPRVWVVGAGVRSHRQLTLEALACLRVVGHVHFFPQAGLTSAWLEETVGVERAVDLTRYYVDGAIDMDNYRRIVRLVGDAARERGSSVLLMAGHPRVGVSMTELLEREDDLAVSTIEGVSSFDTMLCDLRRDPLKQSSVVMDANRLLYFKYTLDARFDLYLYHVCSVGTRRTHHSDPTKENRLDLLQQYLLGYFEAAHEVFLVESGQRRDRARVTPLRLDALATAGTDINFGTTLFVPGRDPVAGERDESFARVLAT